MCAISSLRSSRSLSHLLMSSCSIDMKGRAVPRRLLSLLPIDRFGFWNLDIFRQRRPGTCGLHGRGFGAARRKHCLADSGGRRPRPERRAAPTKTVDVDVVKSHYALSAAERGRSDDRRQPERTVWPSEARPGPGSGLTTRKSRPIEAEEYGPFDPSSC